MGVNLRLEPYTEMFEEERPGLRIVDAFCFPDIDKLFGNLGMRLYDYLVDAVDGRLPHDAALRLLEAVESHQVPPELTGDARFAVTEKRDKLLLLLLRCCEWYEHPESVPAQMQQFVGTMPGMAGEVGPLAARQAAPRLVLS